MALADRIKDYIVEQYLAGDHVSNHNAWMEGAFESARQAATAIHARAAQEQRTARA